MKVVFLKNKNLVYKYNQTNGFKFKPKNKNINSLVVVNNDILEFVLIKKINKDINKIKKAVKLIINSDVAIVDDCDIMLEEVYRLSRRLEHHYRIYLDEFDYFEIVKDLYFLYQSLNCKKKIIRGFNE